ncbi:MAG: Uma2 family endonuclease [Planctomycetota bacterium]
MLNSTPTVHSRPIDAPPVLEAADHLDQPTFHKRYESMPEDFRAELIGGLVVVPSPLSRTHARYHAQVIRWLGQYETRTPGTAVLDNVTVILSPDTEVQPDACITVEPCCGGQTRTDERDYVHGAPELVVEVASSSESYDVHDKLKRYEEAGVREYIVITIRQLQTYCFRLVGGQYMEQSTDADGVYRSSVLPGLHLHAKAMLNLDWHTVEQCQARAFASSEHAAFVADLASRRARSH